MSLIKEEPLVSVIVPAYNSEKTLSICLSSLLIQTYKNYEIIVIDNNSNDNTKFIINKYKTKCSKIKTIFEPHRSRGAARNAGLEIVNGDIIAMIDSDCVAPKNWIEQITSPIRKNKELMVQGNEADCINNYWTSMEQDFNSIYLKNRGYDSYIDHFDTKNCAFRKRIITELGHFNKNLKNCEDFELKLRLHKKGYRIYFAQNCRVQHFHKDTLIKTILRRVNQGFWSTKIYYLHRNYLKGSNDSMVTSLNPIIFFSFFISIFIFLIRKGFKKFYFEFVTGISWRIGIIEYHLYRIFNKT